MDDIRKTALDRFRLYLERRQFSAHTIVSELVASFANAPNLL